jgi:hypothetical protein
VSPRLDVGRWIRDVRDGWYSVVPGDVDPAEREPLAEAPPGEPGPLGQHVTSAFSIREPPAGLPAEPSWSLVHLSTRGWSRLPHGGTLTEALEILGYGGPEHGEPTDLAEAAPRLVRFRLEGSWGRLDSGLRVESVTAGLEKAAGPSAKPDQEGAEAWLGLRLGRLRLKASAEAFADNVRDDAERAQTATSRAGLTLELALPGDALLSLSGMHGGSTVAAPARADGTLLTPAPSEFDTVVASLYRYGGAQWDLWLSSSRTVETTGRDDAGSTVTTHDLSASYRPTARVTLTPALSLSGHDAATAGTPGYQSLSASLTLVLARLVPEHDLTLYAGYSRSRTTDGAFDTRSVDGTVSLVRTLRRASPRATLAFELGYHHSLDAASGLRPAREAVAQVTLRLASF